MPFLNYKPLKLQLRVFLASNTVPMVTCCVTKMVPTSSSMAEQFFDTMIVALTDNWKLFRATLKDIAGAYGEENAD